MRAEADGRHVRPIRIPGPRPARPGARTSAPCKDIVAPTGRGHRAPPRRTCRSRRYQKQGGAVRRRRVVQPDAPASARGPPATGLAPARISLCGPRRWRASPQARLRRTSTAPSGIARRRRGRPRSHGATSACPGAPAGRAGRGLSSSGLNSTKRSPAAPDQVADDRLRAQTVAIKGDAVDPRRRFRTRAGCRGRERSGFVPERGHACDEHRDRPTGAHWIRSAPLRPPQHHRDAVVDRVAEGRAPRRAAKPLLRTHWALRNPRPNDRFRAPVARVRLVDEATDQAGLRSSTDASGAGADLWVDRINPGIVRKHESRRRGAARRGAHSRDRCPRTAPSASCRAPSPATARSHPGARGARSAALSAYVAMVQAAIPGRGPTTRLISSRITPQQPWPLFQAATLRAELPAAYGEAPPHASRTRARRSGPSNGADATRRSGVIVRNSTFVNRIRRRARP